MQEGSSSEAIAYGEQEDSARRPEESVAELGLNMVKEQDAAPEQGAPSARDAEGGPVWCADISLGGLLLQLVLEHGGLSGSLEHCRMLQHVNRLWFVSLVDVVTGLMIVSPMDKAWHADFQRRNAFAGREASSCGTPRSARSRIVGCRIWRLNWRSRSPHW